MACKTKVEINAGFMAHERTIRDMISAECPAEIIHRNRRNIIETVSCDGLVFVVKRYKPRSLYHRILYTGLRSSKARKAYDNALALINAGIATAVPVAYAETRKGGLFQEGVFVSLFVNGGLIVDIYSPDIDADKKRDLCDALGVFTYELHTKGFLPLDYNPGNLIYSRRATDDRYQLTLIDINRMSTGKIPDIEESMRSFSQIGLRPEEFLPVLRPYSDLRGFDLEKSIYSLLKWRRKIRRFKGFKHGLGRIFGLRH